jgi:TPR repeat protein
MVPTAKTVEPTATFALPIPRTRPFSGADIAWLLARGDWSFATGDVASARFLYERGVDAGAARAAMRLGETFDPVYLHYSHLRGLRGDPGMAVFWYRRARDLGATGVANRLERLEAIERRN